MVRYFSHRISDSLIPIENTHRCDKTQCKSPSFITLTTALITAKNVIKMRTIANKQP